MGWEPQGLSSSIFLPTSPRASETGQSSVFQGDAEGWGPSLPLNELFLSVDYFLLVEAQITSLSPW